MTIPMNMICMCDKPLPYVSASTGKIVVYHCRDCGGYIGTLGVDLTTQELQEMFQQHEKAKSEEK